MHSKIFNFFDKGTIKSIEYIELGSIHLLTLINFELKDLS